MRTKTISFIKLTAIVLVSVLLLTLTAPVAMATRPFADVSPGAFYHDAVLWAYENGITVGQSEGGGMFRPGAPVSRAMFATFIWRAAGEPEPDGAVPVFRDQNVINSRTPWAARAIAWAASANVEVTTGFDTDGTFRPSDSITREQMMVMLFRYAAYRGADMTSPASRFNGFLDRGGVSSWARIPMQWATYHGIMTGSDGRLLPRNNTTRGQAVTVLHRTARSGLLCPDPIDEIFNYINPLTGLGSVRDITANRPVAVSLGNTRPDGLPTNATNGISQADIVYEFLVENNNTRLLAIYQDFTDVGLVGSIRSVRPYIVDIAEAYDALLIHAHGTAPALRQIDEHNVTNFCGRYGPRIGIFTRRTDRIPGHTVGWYHSVTTSGHDATVRFPAYRIRLEHHEGFEQELSFTDAPIPSGGSMAHSVELRFSSGKTSSFSFSECQNHYYMSQFGSRFADANNNARVAFTNLLILKVSVTPLDENLGNPERLAIDTLGPGTGYFVSNGRVININWSRECQASQFVYTLADGSPLELGTGRTYIGLLPEDESVTFR